MQRTRLFLAALASSLLLTAGCASMHEDECHSGGWLSRFRLASRTTTSAPCDCEGESGAIIPHGEGPVMVPPNAYGPNTFVPPPPSMMTVPPGTSQPPRIIPVPQASPMPYTPQ